MEQSADSGTPDMNPNEQIRELECKLKEAREPRSPTPTLRRQSRPLKVLVVADRRGWAFSTRAEALRRNAPPHLSIDTIHYSYQGLLSAPLPLYDCIFVLPPNKTKELRLTLSLAGCKAPLISSWNSGPGRDGYEIMDIVPYADWIVVNNWQSYAQALKRTGGRFSGCHISNGVDLALFRPTVPIEERPSRVLWIAAENKAQDEDDVKGWRSVAQPLGQILTNLGIETDFRTPAPDEELSDAAMVDFYNSGSVFLITSTSEGTPNTGLEAAACGCAVVSSRVGNMVEIIRDEKSGILVERLSNPPTPQFLRAVQYALQHRSRLGHNARLGMEADGWDWAQRCKYFYRVFEAAARGELSEMKPWSYLDQ